MPNGLDDTYNAKTSFLCFHRKFKCNPHPIYGWTFNLPKSKHWEMFKVLGLSRIILVFVSHRPLLLILDLGLVHAITSKFGGQIIYELINIYPESTPAVARNTENTFDVIRMDHGPDILRHTFLLALSTLFAYSKFFYRNISTCEKRNTSLIISCILC